MLIYLFKTLLGLVRQAQIDRKAIIRIWSFCKEVAKV